MSAPQTLWPVVPDSLEEATRLLLTKACDSKLLLANAESCTGGMLASLLTDVKGVAHALERGFVTYSEDAKIDLLGVDPDLIARKAAIRSAANTILGIGDLARLESRPWKQQSA